MDNCLHVEVAEGDSTVTSVIMLQKEGQSRGYYEDYV